MACPQQIAEESSSRIYGLTDLQDGFLSKIQAPTKPVLDMIGKIYRRRVKMNKEFLANGFCFGLLDPAANVVANGFMAPWGGGAEPPQDDRNMEQRSLDGLVAFLTYLFPYLPEAEATAYLDAAKADPLVAAHLVVIRRGLRDSSFLCNNTAAVETALRCAAVAGQRPDGDPERFVVAWKQLSSGLNGLASLLSRAKPDYESALSLMDRMRCGTTGTSSARELDLKTSWELARARLAGLYPPGKELPPARAAMKRVLLATIHGFYLTALGCLPPTHAPRSTCHRSMLKGGHCYGPLDPVSNIIVNTIWYGHNFPTSREAVALNMISTECLWHVASRSFYGLVSFLCTRYPGLTPDHALQRLLVARGDLRAADPYLLGAAPSHATTGTTDKFADASVVPSTSVFEAYAAAATAAFHTEPLAQQEFLGSSELRDKLLELSELMPIKADRVLSAKNLNSLSMAVLKSAWPLEHKTHQPKEPVPVEVSSRSFSRAKTRENRFLAQLQRVSKMVEAALDTFNRNKPSGPPFRLHVICGVNEIVSGPQFSTDPEVKGYNPYSPSKYHHSHINFLAIPEGQEDGPATLFFAEGSNHGTDACWCCPVETHDPLAEQVRCIYCELRKSRIVHTAKQSFHGRDIEFEKVLRGQELFGPNDYTNDAIIFCNGLVDWVHGVDDDAVYANYRLATNGGGSGGGGARRPTIAMFSIS